MMNATKKISKNTIVDSADAELKLFCRISVTTNWEIVAVGEFADDEIKITGRAKDTIVLLGGENIEPAVIEASLLNSPYIERVMIVGQDKKYIAALIVPAKDVLTEWANTSLVMYSSWESLLESNEVQMFFREEIERRVNEKTGFRTCERINRFVLLPNSFETGKEVNAKGEMMRYKITKIYAKEIKSLFA